MLALSSACSDHSPLLQHTCSATASKARFKFEAFWPRFPGYLDAVAEGWHLTLQNADPFHVLDFKLHNTMKALKRWIQKFIRSVRLQLAVAQEVIFRLEQQQDRHSLSHEELVLRSELKVKCLDLASLAQSIARRRSRVVFLVEGDANTCFFHLEACHHSLSNQIIQITCHGETPVQDEDKEHAIFQHFDSVIGLFEDRANRLDLGRIGIPAQVFSGHDHCFSEAEIWSVISELKPDKVPRPDGFTGWFYQTAWPIIKEDILNAFAALWSMDCRNLHLVNQAYMVLLQKKPDPEEVKDYCPISLIHSFSKLATKVLAHRLAPHMDAMVQPNQCAFIRGLSLHDNFRVVQASAKLLHVRKRTNILLKIDIAKAFDMVGWAFLLELPKHLGFSRHWQDWISNLLSSASTRILLNGNPGLRICHARGLRHGDPLSLLLFVLTMEALNALFRLAEDHGLLSSLRLPAIRHCLSFYTDDMVIFTVPTERNIRAVREIIDMFTCVSGVTPHVVEKKT